MWMALHAWYKSTRPGRDRTDLILAEEKVVANCEQGRLGVESEPLIAESLTQNKPDMEIVKLFDRDGDQITVKLEAGRLWPAVMKHVSDVSRFGARADDVFLCCYSRSGTHWVSELLAMLRSNQLRLQKVTKGDAMLEHVGCDHLDNLTSPRVINTHLNYPLLPQDVFRKQCKIVLVCRNPKDVAVSFYHFIKSRKHFEYNGQFAAFLELFLVGKVPYGGWFEYMQEWNSALVDGSLCPIHVLYYEELKQHFVSAMIRLCSFLDLTRPVEFLEEMKKLVSFDSFKRSMDARLDDAARAEWKGAPEFIRKGVVGDWKNWFTVAQNEEFDELYQRRMRGSCFNISFEPDFSENH